MAWGGFCSNSGEWKLGRDREAVPPRLPNGWAAGLDLDRLRGGFREPDGSTASGWNDAEMSSSDCCTLTPFPASDTLRVLSDGASK